MTLIAALVALILEQFRPVSGHWISVPLSALADWLDEKLNDGQYRHGLIAWVLAAAIPATIIQILYLVLMALHPVLGVLLACATLYLTMGFRQFSHYYTDVQMALRMGEVEEARRLLVRWRGGSADGLAPSQIARLAIEEAIVASHRHVFAPMFAFAAIGPGGALLYRSALTLAQRWANGGQAGGGNFGVFATKAFAWLEWLPTRLTATAFAAVGDFEDAVFCWRTQAGLWPDVTTGVLLASGAGAIGVRLGMPVHGSLPPLDSDDRPEIGLGEEADADFMQSTVGLVWRTLMLCLLMMVLVWIAGWVV